jgi:acetyl esterase/lipase
MRTPIALSMVIMLVAGIATAQEGKQPGRKTAPSYRTQPTHPDVKYGLAARNVMDVWLAESDKPTPVLVSIHGGGFSGGTKSVSPFLLEDCLKSGISVVAITYRLSDEAKAPAQFLDSARAIQFIRSMAKEWNLDGSKMAATGGSAGAGISLWLGFHDDLADPKSDDPVLRQSTRLTCMAVTNGQTSCPFLVPLGSEDFLGYRWEVQDFDSPP